MRGPYIAIAAGLLILGVAVAFMHLPHIAQTQEFRPAKEGDPILGRSIWGYEHTVLGALGIFLYVGVEVGLASIAVNFTCQRESTTVWGHGRCTSFRRREDLAIVITHIFGLWTGVGIAAILLSLYWVGALVGRLLGSWVLTKIKSGRLLGVSALRRPACSCYSMFRAARWQSGQS